jgi:hypothetical protein
MRRVIRSPEPARGLESAPDSANTYLSMAKPSRRPWRSAAAAALCTALSGAPLASRAQVPPARPPVPAIPGAEQPGFLMEGDPEVEIVFGDSDAYRKHIDRFYELHEQMRVTRTAFTRAVQAALATLTGHRNRQCPEAALAPLYAAADEGGKQYEELGREFEAQYLTVQRLHRLGETAGLTPDYRWRVNRAQLLYQGTLIDYQEMRLAFIDQLGSEMRYRGCTPQRLLELARKHAGTPPLAAGAVPARQPDPRRKPPPPLPVVPASPATFFVDNRTCNEQMRIYLDGAVLGEVAAGAKVAFQSLTGRHAMCILSQRSPLRCGAPGTVRSSYIYDGWSITMHCASAAPAPAPPAPPDRGG